VTNPFKKATRRQTKLRLMLEGASGSGKTTAALRIARTFGKTALIDTEGGRASYYADEFDFDTLLLEPPFEPERYIEAIKQAEGGGYDVIVIDSITHEWNGPGGCLEIKDKLGGRFQDWAKVSPRHDRFVQSMLRSKCHIIATCRSKQAYSMDEQTKKVTKQGMEPQQRDGLDFEMTVVFQFNQNHIAVATKDNTKLFDGRDAQVTDETGKKLLGWLNSGEAPEPVADVPQVTNDFKTHAANLVKTLAEDKKPRARELWAAGKYQELCEWIEGGAQ
jgi:DNA polymerase III delta prime subunit